MISIYIFHCKIKSEVMFEFRRDFNHTRQVAPRLRVDQSNIQAQIPVIRHLPPVH